MFFLVFSDFFIFVLILSLFFQKSVYKDNFEFLAKDNFFFEKVGL